MQVESEADEHDAGDNSQSNGEDAKSDQCDRRSCSVITLKNAIFENLDQLRQRLNELRNALTTEIAAPSSDLILAVPTMLTYGERGIRTLGQDLRTYQQISNLPLSTTQPSLHGVSH